jgi:hypothetical protein
MDPAEDYIFIKRTNGINKPVPAFIKLSPTTSWKTMYKMIRLVGIKWKSKTLFIQVPVIKGDFIDRFKGVKTKEIKPRIKSEPSVKRPCVNLSKAPIFNIANSDDEYSPTPYTLKKSVKKERKLSVGIIK